MPNPLYDLLFAPLADRPGPLIALADDTAISGVEFLSMIHRAAGALRAQGVHAGDRVAMQAAKTPEVAVSSASAIRGSGLSAKGAKSRS